ncbi:glycosyltransferase family 4 protein [Candidatus Uhrbacteria bacterium]|nr:glycosyltransferase family 4 protein [Candidatus Uhrbacteria bacterium]
MSEKHLLLVTPDFPPNEGGVARYLQAVAEHLKDRIEVLADPHPLWNTFDPQAGYPVYRAPLLSRFIWPRWLKTVRYLWTYRSRYDLILTSHVLPIGSAALLAKKFTGTPYVLFVHGMDIRLAASSSRKRRLATKVLQGARLVVANSQALARELASDFGIHEVLVIYPCVPLPPPPPTPHGGRGPDRSVGAHPLSPPGPFTLLTVSRLVERKGHTHVLNALAHLRGTGELGVFVYHIVGEGPMELSLRSMVETLDLSRQVVFHGKVSDEERQRLYQESDVFVMPISQDPVDKEGFGLVYIEAAAAGLPSIATNVEGVDEAVIDQQTGLLLESQDERLLASAIVFLARNPELRSSMSLQAREHAKTFTCQNQMSKLDLYL